MKIYFTYYLTQAFNKKSEKPAMVPLSQNSFFLKQSYTCQAEPAGHHPPSGF